MDRGRSLFFVCVLAALSCCFAAPTLYYSKALSKNAVGLFSLYPNTGKSLWQRNFPGFLFAVEGKTGRVFYVSSNIYLSDRFNSYFSLRTDSLSGGYSRLEDYL